METHGSFNHFIMSALHVLHQTAKVQTLEHKLKLEKM